VAIRPLRVEELAEVLAIDFSTAGGIPKVNEKLRWEDQEQAVLLACSSLITISDQWGPPIVQFSHFSVKEFLTSDRLAASTNNGLRYHHIRSEPAHTIMAQVCVGVLLRLDNDMDRWTIESYPLAKYASKHLADHAKFGDVLSRVADGIDNLLDPDKPHFDLWLWLQIGDWDDDHWHYADLALNVFRLQRGSWKVAEAPIYAPRVAPLYYVSALGHLCLARHLILTRPQDLDTRDDKGASPLLIALLAGKVEVSQLLIGHCVDFDIRDTYGHNPLHMAAWNGLLDITRMLLEHDGGTKALINARNKNGVTPLHIASRRHSHGVVALLLEFGADVDAEDKDKMTPLFYASKSIQSGEVAHLLLDHGASVHTRNKYGQTPLHLASEYNLSSVVASSLKLGADVNARDDDKATPLLCASSFFVEGGMTQRLLLNHGASVHIRNKNGQTPLHIASRRGLSDLMTLLLKFGADVDVRDNNDMTPLLCASRSSESSAAMQMLLDHDANIHVRNKKGQTPLHLSSRYNSSSIVSLLLKSGAEVDAQDHDNMTALLCASGPFRNDEVAHLLLDHGANIHMGTKKGQTPLHLASENHSSTLVELLLKMGTDVDVQDDDNMTPLHYASGFPKSGAAAPSSLDCDGESVHVQMMNNNIPLAHWNFKPVCDLSNIAMLSLNLVWPRMHRMVTTILRYFTYPDLL
jgi:ankyrin repeat protein